MTYIHCSVFTPEILPAQATFSLSAIERYLFIVLLKGKFKPARLYCGSNHLKQRSHGANKLTVVLNSQNSATLSLYPELKDSKRRVDNNSRSQGSNFSVCGHRMHCECM